MYLSVSRCRTVNEVASRAPMGMSEIDNQNNVDENRKWNVAMRSGNGYGGAVASYCI